MRQRTATCILFLQQAISSCESGSEADAEDAKSSQGKGRPAAPRRLQLWKLLAGAQVDRGTGRYLIGARAREAGGLGGNFRDGK